MEKKKSVVSFRLSKESIEMLNDLSLMLGLNRSVILDRMIKYVYENDLESKLFLPKGKKKKGDNEILTKSGENKIVKSEKKEESTTGFKIKL